MRKACYLCLVLLLSGCAALESVKNFTGALFSSDDNLEPPRELTDYSFALRIDDLWRERVGDGYAGQDVRLIASVADDVVFAASHDGLVQARQLRTGDLLWETDTDLALCGGPGVGRDTVIFGTDDAEVVALDRQTGKVRWKTAVTSEVLSVPVVDRGRVFVRSTDGRLIALEEDTGRELWSIERSMPALSIRGSGSPSVQDGIVYAGFANGKLTALDGASGKMLWETSVAIPHGRSEVDRIVDLVVEPIVHDGVVYIAAVQGGTVAALAQDGDILWRNEAISSHAGLAHDGYSLYVTDGQSDVWQLDLRQGAALWKQDELHQRGLTAPAVGDDYLVVGDFEGYLHWLAVEDGRQLARVRVTRDALRARPVITDQGIVVVYAKNGTLAAYRLGGVE